MSAILRACGVPNTKLTGSSKITAVGQLETRGAKHRVQDLICPLDVQTAKGSINSTIHTGYLMEMSSTGLSRSVTMETTRPTHATVHPYRASSCRDAKVFGSPPLRTMGSLGPSLVCNTLAGSRVPLFVAVRSLSLWDATPGSESSPSSLGRFLGRRPSARPPLPGDRRPLTHSPRREVVSGPAHTRGAHPTASGRLKTVALFQQSALLSCGSQVASLWVASPGDSSQLPLSYGRSLGRRSSFLLR